MRSGKRKFYRALAAVGFSAPLIHFSAATLKADNTITTTFAGGNGFNGNFFDIQTGTGNIGVTGMTVNVDAGTEVIDVYDRLGSFASFQTSSAGWTLVSQTTVTGLGAGTPTPVAVTPFVLPANSTTGMYVTIDTTMGTALEMTYSNGTTNYSNGDMTITYGDGSGGMFCANGDFNPRVWNGSITYNTIAVPEPAAMTIALAAGMGLLRRRRSK